MMELYTTILRIERTKQTHSNIHVTNVMPWLNLHVKLRGVCGNYGVYVAVTGNWKEPFTKLETLPHTPCNTLLEYDVTRRDPLSVVMVCWFTRRYSLRITLIIIYNIGAHAQWFRVNRHP